MLNRQCIYCTKSRASPSELELCHAQRKILSFIKAKNQKGFVKPKRLLSFEKELERGLFCELWSRSVDSKGDVLQNASRSATVTQLQRAFALVFKTPFSVFCTAWDNHFYSATLQGSRIYCISQLEIIYFDYQG